MKHNSLKHIFLILSYVCSSLFTVNSQAQTDTSVTLMISDTFALKSDRVCIPIRVMNFDSVEGFQFSVHFDPTLLFYREAKFSDNSIDTLQIFFDSSQKIKGKVSSLFFDPFESHTLADSASLFSLCFDVIGEPGELCPINIGDDPLDVAIIVNENEVEFNTVDGRLDILDDDVYRIYARSCPAVGNTPTGNFEVSIYGGNPPYTYIWRHSTNSSYSGGGGLDTFGKSFMADELIPGRYTIRFVDEDGAVLRDSFIVRDGNTFTYDVVIDTPQCDNIADGQIEISNISGWVSTTHVKWNDGTLFKTTREELQSGSYEVTFTGIYGCQVVDTFDLLADGIDRQISIIDESCFGDEQGQFDLQISGGQPINDTLYQIIFDGDTTLNDIFQQTGLTSGTYAIKIIDSANCHVSNNIRVRAGLQMGLGAFGQDEILCHGDSNGLLSAAVTAFRGQLSDSIIFHWNVDSVRYQNTYRASAYLLPAGTYPLTIEDAKNQCSFDTSFTLDQPSPIKLDSFHFVKETCMPGIDGALQIFASGGRDTLPYVINWEGGVSGDSIGGISAGMYTYSITDENSCFFRDSLELLLVDKPQIDGFTTRNFRCDSIAQGRIAARVFPGDSPVNSYLWDDSSTSSIRLNLLPDTFSLIVTDTFGCVDSATIIVNEPAGPSIDSFNIINVQCAGDQNGEISIFTSTPSSFIESYTWSNDSITPTISNLSSGAYSVSITDTVGCISIAATTLLEPDTMYLVMSAIKDTAFTNLGAVIANVTGGVQPYHFDWLPNVGVPIDSMLTELGRGVYEVTVTDAHGCMLMDTAYISDFVATDNIERSIEISIFPNPVGNELVLRNPLNFNGEAVLLKIVDQVGKTTYSRFYENGIKEERLDLSTFSAGLYFLTITDHHQRQMTRRIIKL